MQTQWVSNDYQWKKELNQWVPYDLIFLSSFEGIKHTFVFYTKDKYN